MLAVQYLYEKAQELRRPIAICIGLGSNYGAHNNATILERYLNNIAVKNGVSLCVCNGNEANKATHSVLNLNEIEEEKSFEINVAEDEEGFMLTIVLYPGDRAGINIISPLGEVSGRIPYRANYDEEIFFTISDTRIRVQYFSGVLQSSGQFIAITFTKPSFGIWRVNVYAQVLIIGEVHAWLPISNFISNNTYFLNPDAFYTVTTPATANNVISVGGYNHINNSLFVSSGRGPTRLNSLKPILVAPAENVSCISNIGFLETISGTSVSAAITAGCTALLLQWGVVRGNSPVMNSTTIIGALIAGTNKRANESFPNNLWGFGILDIFRTFENL